MTEMKRLSALIDAGVEMSRAQAHALAEAEELYRLGKREAWAKCPNDEPGVRAGEREWTAARREAWVDAECAALRKARDQAEMLRDAAREAVRSRQTQLSAWQTLVTAHKAEAEFARTAPSWAA
jgi:hypothetical protein